ncbi:hypothetical protein S40288_01962 [Stachybotrys chartarum IBT 40288]|nr:hypothetical protein S40288_01962 [Stachybotrys chartarum IBT 40288]
MDKMSRFRRRPKPPTIETDVHRPSTSTTSSPLSGLSAMSAISTRNAEAVNGHEQWNKPSGKKPILHNLRLRASGKRARGISPASLESSPVPVVVGHDGSPPRATDEDGNASDASRQSKPRMPHFLTLSSQGGPKLLISIVLHIESKFHELVWAERHRVSQGSKHDASPENKWGTFKQTDSAQRGTMDRYFNIKPWNHNRVKLNVTEAELGYVNASSIVVPSIDSSKPPLRYIAMQGPTEPSFDYVWRMVAEQMESPAVIVQLTTMVEGGLVKCHQYFPTDGDEQTSWTLNETDVWGDGWKAELSHESVEELAGGAIQKRKLLLSVEGEAEPRVIWHLLYLRWPDFGVPTLDDLDGFFDMMQLSHELSHPSNPRIVHCSAGVGRTGTFICLEHLMRELEAGTLEKYNASGEQQDLIFDTVDLLRQQRRAMVQAEAQYQFIYQVLHKLWVDKYGGRNSDDSSRSKHVAKRLGVEEAAPGHGHGSAIKMRAAQLDVPSPAIDPEPVFEHGPGPDIGRA